MELHPISTELGGVASDGTARTAAKVKALAALRQNLLNAYSGQPINEITLRSMKAYIEVCLIRLEQNGTITGFKNVTVEPLGNAVYFNFEEIER